MPNAKLSALLFLLVVATPPLMAQEDEVCNRYKYIPLPSEATTTPVPTESPTCDSYKSYAGIGRSQNYAAAFACAWTERAAQVAQLQQNPKSILSWVVGGSLILSDLYANGRGTPQNLPLAIHFACEQKEAFISEAFTDLESRTNRPGVAKPFELCDYAATTFEMNFCASYSNDKSNSDRDRETARLSRNWPAQQKAAFLSAKKAYDSYVKSVESEETYKGGTVRDIRAFAHADELQRDFAEALRRYESGKLPHASAAEYEVHDAELNRVFHESLKSAQRRVASDKADGLEPEEEIQANGIRKTERAWLAYRDAWVSFATLHYSGTTREAWLDELTKSRVHRLLLLACDEESQEMLCTNAVREESDHDD